MKHSCLGKPSQNFIYKEPYYKWQYSKDLSVNGKPGILQKLLVQVTCSFTTLG